jgi:hypothetical protein
MDLTAFFVLLAVETCAPSVESRVDVAACVEVFVLDPDAD